MKKNLSLFVILGHFDIFLILIFLKFSIFFIFRILKDNKNFNYNMQSKGDIKTFDLRCRWTLYDQLHLRFVRLIFRKNKAHRIRVRYFSKFCNFCYFQGLSFEHSMEFLRSIVSEIYTSFNYYL